MNKITYILILTCLLVSFSCKEEKQQTTTNNSSSIIEKTVNSVKSKLSFTNLINESGETIATRFNAPNGFERAKTED